jgi:hypothetical protein
MKNLCLAFALSAASLCTTAATSVGVSIGIDQPGLYGRVDIGTVRVPPVLVYTQPVVIVPTPVSQVQTPIYLHVPPGQARDWRRHCAAYGACNRPVYFVQEGWYHDHYRTGDEKYKHGKGQGNAKGKGKGHDKH